MELTADQKIWAVGSVFLLENLGTSADILAA